jgi:hypothetical protein
MDNKFICPKCQKVSTYDGDTVFATITNIDMQMDFCSGVCLESFLKSLYIKLLVDNEVQFSEDLVNYRFRWNVFCTEPTICEVTILDDVIWPNE